MCGSSSGKYTLKLPLFVDAGGPTGGGHFTFSQSQAQYVVTGAAHAIRVSMGLSIVAVVRFTDAAGQGERIFFVGEQGEQLQLFRLQGQLRVGLFEQGSRSCALSAADPGAGTWLTLILIE